MSRPGITGTGESAKRQAVLHLEHQRKLLVPRISQREAAARVGLSRQRWEEIVAGRKRRGGVMQPVEPPYETIMLMAKAVGAQHRVAQILGMISPDDPEPSPLTIELRDEREARIVRAMLEQLRAEEQAARQAEDAEAYSYGVLRAG